MLRDIDRQKGREACAEEKEREKNTEGGGCSLTERDNRDLHLMHSVVANLANK